MESALGKDAMRLQRHLRAGAEAIAAVSVASAGAIHLRFGPSHLAESLAYGVFFFGVASLQLTVGAAIGVALARTRPISGGLRWSAIVLNVGVIAVWGVTRVIGPPVGPNAGEAEAVDYADLATVAFQLVSVLAVLVAARAPETPVETRELRRPAAIAAVVGALFAVPLVIAASPHGHEPSRDHGHEEPTGDNRHRDVTQPPRRYFLDRVIDHAAAAEHHGARRDRRRDRERTKRGHLTRRSRVGARSGGGVTWRSSHS